MKTIVTYIEWLYLKEGQLIKIDGSLTVIYKGWEHSGNDGMMKFICENQLSGEEVTFVAHKKSLIPVLTLVTV